MASRRATEASGGASGKASVWSSWAHRVATAVDGLLECGRGEVSQSMPPSNDLLIGSIRVTVAVVGGHGGQGE
jgi:hypothetical protein